MSSPSPPFVALALACCVASATARAQAAPGERGAGAGSGSPGAPPQTVALAGEVLDLETGRVLAGATAYLVGTTTGDVTDDLGRYALRVPLDAPVVVRFAYLGYEPVTRELRLARDGRFDVYLTPGASNDLAEVVVSAREYEADGGLAAAPLDALDVRDVKLVAGLLGEADVLQALKLRPGISSGSESNHGLYVRGGSTDQNLVLLGGAKLYNPYHLFGFVSTFNPDAVRGVRLHKGAFPVRYGGRLASVIDVAPREGGGERLAIRGGIGLLSSRLGVDGPIERGRSSFAVSARRTYVDLLTGPINRATDGEAARGEPLPGYNFHDLNARADFALGPRDRLSVDAYHGRDRLAFEGFFFDLGLAWGNTAASATWRRAAAPATSVTTVLSASRYDYDADNRTAGYDFALASGITDLSLATHVEHVVDPRLTLSAGGSAASTRYAIADVAVADEGGGVSYSGGDVDVAGEYAAYADAVIRPASGLSVVPGVRLGAYVNDAATFLRPEPRLRAEYAPGRRVGLQASYSRMVQYAHLVAPAGLALPIDFWHPSTEQTLPQVGDQVSAGVSYAGPASWSVAAQGFYKEQRHQVEFVDGANPFTTADIEREFDYGRGYAYGAEVKLERLRGRLRGWAGYTYQRIRRGGFARIMEGRSFSPRHDRRHDISAVLTYELTPRLQATATWVYGSGDLAWLPEGRQVVADAPGADPKAVVPVYGDRNNYRLAAYHRADASLVWRLAPRWGESDLTFAVYNLYDRRNAFFVYLRPENRTADVAGTPIQVPRGFTPKQQSLFPILPSVTWNFAFSPGRPAVPNPGELPANTHVRDHRLDIPPTRD